MKTYDGDVKITVDNQKEWEERLKGIQKITGSVAVSGSAKAEFPLLAEVGGYVDVYGSAKAEFPLLAEVGGYVDVYGSAKAEFPKHKITHNPCPIREIFNKKGYLFADNILSRIINKKKFGKGIIYKTTKIGNRHKIVYVVQKGEMFSHGETIEQAIHDLRYKLSDRDTAKYKNWKMDSVHPIADIIGAYRAITGACETWTKQWCDGKKFPAEMSIKIAIDKTTGAYGADKFAAFFKQ